MVLWPPRGTRATRSESHAFLDGVLPPPYAEWTTPGEVAAFEAGLKLAGLHPFAECRETPEKGTGLHLYEVHDPGGPREPRVPDAHETRETLAVLERTLLDAKEARLRDELARRQQEARIAELEAALGLDQPK